MAIQSSIRQCVISLLCLLTPHLASAGAEGKGPDCDDLRRFTFSWALQDGCSMQPRGGSSRGADITLDPAPHDGWLALQEDGLSDFERDRRAILAMAGPYRTSFDFLEVVGYTEDFTPDRPYQSWGTEYVYVVEDRGDYIGLQHIMVMVFKQDDGSISEPMVMKHWRQDWQYEKKENLVYSGHETWTKRPVPENDIKGSWSQAVYQVDDSPRYESHGKWQHKKNFSTWISATTWRPLPRREYSVRDDYQVLEGTNRHTIVANGWVHEEQNNKLVLDENGTPSGTTPYLAKEYGANRYQRIIKHDFTPGDRYWENTGNFWSDVRQTWSEIIAGNKQLKLHKTVDGRPLFMPLFGRATTIHSEQDYNKEKDRAFIVDTVERYIK